MAKKGTQANKPINIFRTYKVQSIENIIDFEHNSRTHSEEQIEEVVNSINEFGYTNPILVDEKNVIIAGHCRVAGAKRAGLTEIPTIIVDGLTDVQKSALVIADNKMALNAGWNYDKLIHQISFLRDSGYNTDLTGFKADEIATFMPDEIPPFEGDEDAIGEAPIEPITKFGDVWLLGKHRLLCGSSTMVDDVEKLLAGNKPNLMITDPPYGVKYEASWRAEAKNRKKTEREETSNLMNDDQADWYDAYVLFPGNVVYVWHASAFTDVVMDGLRRSDFEPKQQIIWNKNIHALSRSDYHWKHEPCWYAIRNGKDHSWNGSRKEMTIWDVNSIINEEGKTSHPTQKPVELYLRSIENHTKAGDYIYDPFGGSGTLIIACEKTKRRALSIELDPKFCDVIVARWEKFTGKKAELENSDGTGR